MQSHTGANSVATLLVNSRGWNSLHVVFSQTRNFTGIAFTDANTVYTRLHWRNAKVKATDSDRRVWPLHLPVLSLLCAWARHWKTRTVRAKRPSNLHVRAARFYFRLHLRKWKTHSKCMCQCSYTYGIIFVYCDCAMYSTVRCSYKCNL